MNCPIATTCRSLMQFVSCIIVQPDATRKLHSAAIHGTQTPRSAATECLGGQHATLKYYLWPPYVIGQAIIFLPCGYYLYIFLQRAQLHCKRCISYGNSVYLSVCPSVCLSHAGIVSKRRHVARCGFHRWIGKCV